ncbi:MAG: SDR family oxidoreductase [Planctomycetes bacterium]|nr:SDR family oxidoreductase [Planctomycetota bacterium]
MDFGLAGKAILVTGGTRGVGRGISEALLDAGARVAAGYGGNHEEAKRFLESRATEKSSRGLLVIPADLAREEDHEKLLDAVREAFGPLDGLVNGAAIKVPEDQLGLPQLAQMAVVNAIAPVSLTYRALDFFSPRGASVVNILTVLKEVYYPEPPQARAMVHHGASKGYLETASKLMMDECRHRGVRVNCIAPGPTRGGGLSKSEATHAERFRHGQYGMKRRAEIADVAAAVLFLLSPCSSHITGQTLYVAGGQERAPFFYPRQKE